MTPPTPGRTTALLAGIGALGAALVLLRVSAWGAASTDHISPPARPLARADRGDRVARQLAHGDAIRVGDRSKAACPHLPVSIAGGPSHARLLKFQVHLYGTSHSASARDKLIAAPTPIDTVNHNNSGEGAVGFFAGAAISDSGIGNKISLNLTERPILRCGAGRRSLVGRDLRRLEFQQIIRSRDAHARSSDGLQDQDHRQQPDDRSFCHEAPPCGTDSVDRLRFRKKAAPARAAGRRGPDLRPCSCRPCGAGASLAPRGKGSIAPTERGGVEVSGIRQRIGSNWPLRLGERQE